MLGLLLRFGKTSKKVYSSILFSYLVKLELFLKRMSLLILFIFLFLPTKLYERSSQVHDRWEVLDPHLNNSASFLHDAQHLDTMKSESMKLIFTGMS